MGLWDTLTNTLGPTNDLLRGQPLGTSWGNLMGGAPYEQQQNELLQALRARAMGQGPSLVDAQYRQALERGQASQQSIAAGARPGQTGMAQRLAAQGQGDLSAQLGTAAIQGRLAEQQQAQQLLAQFLAQLNATPTTAERGLGMMQGLGQSAMLLSDRRRKEAVRPGGRDADVLIRALQAKSYRYRDKADGAGPRLGVMAQDVERAPGGQAAVITTPRGKAIDVPQFTGMLGAAVGRLGERLAALEQKGR